MTLILTGSDLEELYEQVPDSQSDDSVLSDFKVITNAPDLIGRGCSHDLSLLPGVQLTFSDYEYAQDLMIKESAHEHPIQIGILLSGFLHCDIHPCLGGKHGYFSGSGISPAYVETYRTGDHITCVNVEFEPEVLESFFLTDCQRDSEPMQQLFQGEDWKVSFYPTVTAKMRSIAQQMWNAPYQGWLRRMYLQAKVFELLVMQLDWIGVGRSRSDQSPKRTTIDRIYHAREIMLLDLENPPSALELAQQVGVSVCTLQRRFQELFGMTVFGYLTDQRMQLAEQLLRQGHCTVAEISAIVGYSNPSFFAAAFKRRFGITPKECLLGKKIVLQ
ncbi:MAG: helix-turn-helix transcriptional regulator [Leptolyngbyaceae cyanobacterium SM1_4_3]|nr:helix-turn-helix transcriptional regulator [Leptolyngbyaceae cyanobacterium SM1_4_3]